MAEYWSNNDRGYRIRLWIDQVSQNIESNSSQVRVRLALLNTSTTFGQYNCSGYVDLNGQRLNYSGRPDMYNYNSSIWLIDQTITVGHNADGSKSFGLSASFSGSGGWSPGTLSISGNSFTLTTIPRASSLSVETGTIGRAVTIYIHRHSNSFKHTLRYAWGNKTGNIASNIDTSYSWTIPNDFANDVPNAVSGVGTIYVDTYSGSSKIGTQEVSLTANVPENIKPSFTGVSLTDTNGVARELLSGNNFVQIVSNIQVNFNGASGSYGSRITGYKAEIVNKNQFTNSNGGTLGIMNFAGSATIRASVFDSRGRQSDTKDVTINVMEYFAPVLSFTATRTRATPNIIQVIRNARIAPLVQGGRQKNVMTLRFKVAPLNTSNYAADNGSATGTFTTVSSLTNSAANLAGNYATNRSFVVIGTLSDKFTSTEFSATVATESVTMSYDKDGRVGIGKVVEFGRAGSLDVKGDIYADGRIIQQYQLTQPSGQLSQGSGQWDDGWNKQATILGWRSGKYDDNPTGKNGEWGLFQNYWLDSWKGAQFFTAVGSGRHFIRVYNDANSWKPTKWKEVAFTDHANLINTGWQSANFPGTYYKRVGDVLTIKYDFKGNGQTITFADIPKHVWQAPQSYMQIIAGWSIGGSDNTHVQINQGTSNMHALSTGNNVIYRGQLTIML